MGMDLFALRKSKVSIKQMDDFDDEVHLQREFIDSYSIWSSWRNSDIDAWPKCLQNFWWHIYDYNSAQYYTKKIRKYYPNDKELIRFAYWLETFDRDVIFELSI
jgi:hypothetical protein